MRMEKNSKGKEGSRVGRKPMKMKYISSPVMVRARDAYEFRSIVNQLTGKYSDITSPVEYGTNNKVVTNSNESSGDEVVVDDVMLQSPNRGSESSNEYFTWLNKATDFLFDEESY